jgi:type II secretory pathway pseudopilin PulG
MIEYISFWFAKALAEILIVVLVFGLLVGAFTITNVYYTYKVRKRDQEIQRRRTSRDTCGND